jgi:very-short-patch-repair endonuclease
MLGTDVACLLRRLREALRKSNLEHYLQEKGQIVEPESPQELRLLKAIRADGTLPEPVKQHTVYDAGRTLTRADFAYLDCQPQLLIYVDGLEWHSAPRQRVHDNRITNRLQALGYHVVRFLGTETHNTPQACVAQIKEHRKACLPRSHGQVGPRHVASTWPRQESAGRLAKPGKGSNGQ